VNSLWLRNNYLSTWDLEGSTCLRRPRRSLTSSLTRCRSADSGHVTSTSSSRNSSPSSWRHCRHDDAAAAATDWPGPPASCHVIPTVYRLAAILEIRYDTMQRVVSLVGSVFRWDFRRVLNSDWDQRSAKKWSLFFVWSRRLAKRLAEIELRTERSLNPKLINSPVDFACTK